MNVPANTSVMVSLTMAEALVLVEREFGLYLPKVQSLSPEVADVLSKHEGPFLDLDGLTSICEATAKALSSFDGELSLTGLKEISHEVGVLLASKPGGRIYLPENFRGSAAGAKAIVDHKGKWVAPENIDELEPTLAFALARSERALSFQRVTELTDDLARALADHRGELLCLDGLTELSAEMAGLLANRPGHLSFDGLKHLAPMTAKALSQHRSRCVFLSVDDDWSHTRDDRPFDDPARFIKRGLSQLGIDGIPRKVSIRFLTEDMAAAFATLLQQHEGVAFYPTTITVAAPFDDKISQYIDIATGNAATSFSSETVCVFLKCDYKLYLNGIRDLSVDDAQLLAQHRGDIFLSGVTSLPDASLAAKLASTDDNSLYLNRLMHLPPGIAAELATFSGERLFLNGLHELPDASARSLAGFAGHCLALSRVKTLTEAAATALAEFRGRDLILNGLEDLQGGIAEALSRFKGGNLSLSKLRNLALGDASHLAGISCSDLRLDGLRGLGAGVAAKLATFKGQRLFLSGISELSAEEARELAVFAGTQLYLDGLKAISKDAARALAAYAGDCLCIRGIADLPPEVADIFMSFRGGNIYTRDHRYRFEDGQFVGVSII